MVLGFDDEPFFFQVFAVLHSEATLPKVNHAYFEKGMQVPEKALHFGDFRELRMTTFPSVKLPRKKNRTLKACLALEVELADFPMTIVILKRKDGEADEGEERK